MRVLYLNPFSQEVSGPDESLRTLLGALIPRGLEAHLVLPAPGPQVPRYEALGAQVHFAPLAVLRRDLSFAAAAYPARLARSAVAIGALARRVGADLIHTNMEVLLEGGLAARALGLPHVLHYRGNTIDRPKWAFDLLVAAWTRASDRVFCISGATAEIFRRRRRDARVEVLYNPIDLERFRPGPASREVRAALGAGPGQPLVGTVGRIHPRKDLETFVRAAARIAVDAPEVRFAIVGAAEAPVEETYRARLDTLVRELGLEGRLIFAGARRDVPDVMRALDLFLLTSRHEGFGRVVAEAMAAARPSVVTDEGALPELVERGAYGLCAPAGDDAAFAAQALTLLGDPSAAAALGGRAAEGARRFDVVSVAERVWSCYLALTGDPAGVRRTSEPTARAP
jgi:glycosyltransferase involved in cell wall biosynthesis